MNDQVKLLIAGAVIGIAGAVAGGLVVAWAMASDGGRRTGDGSRLQPSSVISRPSSVNGQRPIQISPSALPVLGGTNMRSGAIRGTNVHLLTSVATNGGKRLLTSSPTGGMSFAAIQQVQNVPEVKKAREEAAAAQRRYFEAMKKAVENGPRSGMISPSTP
jgi:hypothetical protein